MGNRLIKTLSGNHEESSNALKQCIVPSSHTPVGKLNCSTVETLPTTNQPRTSEYNFYVPDEDDPTTGMAFSAA